MSNLTFFILTFFFTIHLQPASAQQLSSFSISNSPWLPSQNKTLRSPDTTFSAGFLPTSPNLYVFSIWVQNSSDKTIIWTLNHDQPVNGSSSLTFSPSGELSLNDSSGRNLWPHAIGRSTHRELVLKEDGELVFGSWSSFNQPTDTILSNQRLPRTGFILVSGNFQFVNATSLVFNRSSDSYWSSTNGFLNLTSDGNLLFDNGNFLVTSDLGEKPLRRLTLDGDGNLRVYSLNSGSGKWKIVWQAVQELCTIHGTCGSNSICVDDGFSAVSTSCVCLPGFRRTGGDSGSSCERKKTNLERSKFLRLDFMNFVQNGDFVINETPLTFNSCKSRCLGNSSCTGFKYSFNWNQYCVTHHSDLFTNLYWSPANEFALFLRLADSETDSTNIIRSITSKLDTACPIPITLPLPPNQFNTTARNLAIIGTIFAVELLAGIISFWVFLKKYSKQRNMARTLGLEFLLAGGPRRFSYAELKTATSNFSEEVGHGGFGVVYKGELPDHRIIAVKRLKNISGGETEFWAEVTIIARMHHLNLVRMWGFCIEKEQRMLVYEYIPNGSLNKYIFPPIKAKDLVQKQGMGPRSTQQTGLSREGNNMLITQIDGGCPVDVGLFSNTDPKPPLLDWNIRYRIAVGVARAVAYLHEECLEWVLHCDIKPENILLDDDFCPKVSDFGLAKLTQKEDRVSLSRIRGTRGYMAPEWVMIREPITAKADVYSFGMVLLEIVSGIRNFDFQRSSLESEEWYFPKWAFEKVYLEKKVEDILDRRILDRFDNEAHFPMVERMVKTAMWCLQDRPEMRPSMGKVAKMLEGTVEITEPGKPTIFYLENNPGVVDWPGSSSLLPINTCSNPTCDLPLQE